MPYLNLKLSAQPSPEAAEKLSSTLTDLTARILNKKKALTSVVIECVPSAMWAIGSESVTARGYSTFFLEVIVTEGTNTKDEKEAYIAAVFDAVGSALGKIDPVSYIVVHEIRADAWGYGGKTQENRYIKHKPY